MSDQCLHQISRDRLQINTSVATMLAKLNTWVGVGVVAGSIEHRLPEREMLTTIIGRVQPVTYKLDSKL